MGILRLENSSQWIDDLFVQRGELFLQILNHLWHQSEPIVDGIVELAQANGVASGKVLDICCGNGRIAIPLARRGFDVIGIDISKILIEDAKSKAQEFDVKNRTKFIVADVRKIESALKEEGRFNLIISVWTSIGYYDEDTDVEILRQAKSLAKPNGLLIIDTVNRDAFMASSLDRLKVYNDYGKLVVLEEPTPDYSASRVTTKWRFYSKDGNDLKYIDTVEYNVRQYSFHELVRILSKAGWTMLGAYDNLRTLQPFTPKSSRIIVVARAL